MPRLTRVILLLVFGIGGSALLTFLTTQWVFRPAKSREDVFMAYKAGNLKVIDGVIPLPPRFASASLDGMAYVTRESGRTSWLLFLKNRGSGKQFNGYLFCTQAGKTDVKGVVDLHYPSDDSIVTARVVRAQNAWSFEVVNDKP